MDRNLALEVVRVTEAAAIESAHLMGRGDEKAADQAAVDAMRRAFDTVDINGTVVIGEGERDEAPMLYIGEEVGMRRPESTAVDIALDPLEGTTICAKGGVGSLAVAALAERGKFLHAPDTYMDKIAVGPKAVGKVSLEASVADNIHAVADALGKNASLVTAVVLDRPRHENLIREIRETGARIHLIGDGDVGAAISTAWGDMGIDIMMGTGGAPEGVLAAAAMKCVGGDFMGRLNWRSDDEKERASKMGITDFDRVYSLEELAAGPVMFCATGVTHGPFLKGVTFRSGEIAETQSLVMRSKSGTVRMVQAFHDLNRKPKL